MSVYIHERNYNLIDFLIPQRDRHVVDIEDGSSGDTGDEYVIAINEKAVYDDPENPSLVYEKAAVVEDTTPSTSDPGTIASNLATEVNDIYDVVTASASGSTITIETTDRWDYMDFHIETFTTDDEGFIQARPAPPEAYEVQNASSFNGTFTAMETVPKQGLVSDSAEPGDSVGSEHSSLRNYTQFRFNPDDYGLNDDHVTFYKVAPVVNGSTQAAGGVVIVLSSEHLYETHPALVLKDTVPIASDVSGAVEINMPVQTHSTVVKNISDPAENVYLSFGSGSSEWELGQGESFSDNKVATWDMKLRTDASASSEAEVQIYVTVSTERIY